VWSGALAFRSRSITLSAVVRLHGHTVAAARTTSLRPSRAALVLIPSRRAAHMLRSVHPAALTVLITTRARHGGASADDKTRGWGARRLRQLGRGGADAVRAVVANPERSDRTPQWYGPCDPKPRSC